MGSSSQRIGRQGAAVNMLEGRAAIHKAVQSGEIS